MARNEREFDRLVEETLGQVELSELERVSSLAVLHRCEASESIPDNRELSEPNDTSSAPASLDLNSGSDDNSNARRIARESQKRVLDTALPAMPSSSLAHDTKADSEANTHANYCHGCSRKVYNVPSGTSSSLASKKARFAFARCSGVPRRRCHKIFCDQCCVKADWDFTELRSSNRWLCPHCKKVPCPPNMRCHKYSVAAQRQVSSTSQGSDKFAKLS